MDFRGGKTTDIAEQGGGDCRGLESQWTGYEAPCPQFGDLIPSLAGISASQITSAERITQYIFLHFSSIISALKLLVGLQEGHPACKTLGVGLLVVMI